MPTTRWILPFATLAAGLACGGLPLPTETPTDEPTEAPAPTARLLVFDGATGTLTLPAVGDVETGVQYGAGGTEFTGTLTAGSGGGGPLVGASALISA
jgi:hypothetical protein